jgi:hypothetical protein
MQVVSNPITVQSINSSFEVNTFDLVRCRFQLELDGSSTAVTRYRIQSIPNGISLFGRLGIIHEHSDDR